MLYLLLALVFIENIIIILIINYYIQQKKPISRLNLYLKNNHQHYPNLGVKISRADYRSSLNVLGKQTMKLFALNHYRDRIDKSIIRADIPLRVEELIFIIFISILITFTLSVLMTGKIISSIFLVAIVLILFKVIIKNRENKRLIKVNEQLGDALDMMSGSLRAGYSLAQAIETVGKEMPQPISKEFSKVVKEMGFGLSVEEALGNLIDRVPSDDLDLLVTAVVIQRQLGGNLAEIFDNISETIRQRIELKGEVSILTSQARLSGWIIGFLPLIFIMVIFFINPSYIKILFTNRLGLTMLCIGFIGQIIGIILIRRIINIKY